MANKLFINGNFSSDMLVDGEATPAATDNNEKADLVVSAKDTSTETGTAASNRPFVAIRDTASNNDLNAAALTDDDCCFSTNKGKCIYCSDLVYVALAATDRFFFFTLHGR